MKQQIAEMMDVILRHLAERPELRVSVSGMRSWLARQGYNARDIDTVIQLVKPRIEERSTRSRRSTGHIRHLSSFESFKLSGEARDALIRLDLFELIEPYEREMLLERLAQYEGEVDLEDLDYLLSWVLYTTRDVESQQTIYSVLEGNRKALN